MVGRASEETRLETGEEIMSGCSVIGCDRVHEARGLCSLHYGRARIGKPLTASPSGGAAPDGATPIPGYERYYSATPDGRIFSNNYRRTGKPKELAQSTHPEGYRRVKAWFVQRGRGTAVHRLIALTFIPNPLGLPQVNHIDGKKGNNHYTNLEWCDNAWNQKHACMIGLHKVKQGQDHGMAKLSEEQVREILRRLEVGPYLGQGVDLAREFGVTKYCISDIKTRRSWAHL